jgi:succinylglutamate desuccinylase
MSHIQRTLDVLRGEDDGPTLVVVAGIHGNEPAGIEAARVVLSTLREQRIALRGELTVLCGNVRALREQRRFMERDLNRVWTAERSARVLSTSMEQLQHEDLEHRELHEALTDAVARARGPLFLADCHTSSAPGVPFVLFGATEPQRQFVSAFPIPVISGIVEQVDGVLSEYALQLGYTTFSVEGGQHEAPEARTALQGIIWLCLRQANMIDELPEVQQARHALQAMRADLPRAVEVLSRHAITAEDEFVMERGFRNVDRIKKGQLLAHDKRGELRADDDGVVVLPLYQKLGSDGFFWGRELR